MKTRPQLPRLRQCARRASLPDALAHDCAPAIRATLNGTAFADHVESELSED